MNDHKYILEGVFNKCDELHTRKSNFKLLEKELLKLNYKFSIQIKETMESEERNEISVIIKGKKYKIFSNCDPYSDCILDSDLYSRIYEVVDKIKQILNETFKLI